MSAKFQKLEEVNHGPITLTPREAMHKACAVIDTATGRVQAHRTAGEAEALRAHDVEILKRFDAGERAFDDKFSADDPFLEAAEALVKWVIERAKQ